MRPLFAAAAAFVGMAPLSGADALTVWQGEAVITAASSDCAAPGEERRNIGVGTVIKSVLRPKFVDDNGNGTRVAFIHDSGAMFAMLLPFGQMPAGSYSSFGATHSGVLIANRVREYVSFDQAPNTLQAGDIFARLTGTVEDFMFIDGCTASFRATYSKRP